MFLFLQQLTRNRTFCCISKVTDLYNANEPVSYHEPFDRFVLSSGIVEFVHVFMTSCALKGRIKGTS